MTPTQTAPRPKNHRSGLHTDDSVYTSIRIPATVRQAAKQRAAAEGTSLSGIIDFLLRDYINAA